jgi:type VII secretion integral membrane protein EccD
MVDNPSGSSGANHTITARRLSGSVHNRRSRSPPQGDSHFRLTESPMTTQLGGTHCRVSVVTPAAVIDLVLPSHLPVADLLPVILDVSRVDDDGVGTGFRIGRVGAAPIAAELSLGAAGVVDGDLLDLRPISLMVPDPVYDEITDVVAAVAAAGGASRHRTARAVTLGAAAAALGAGAGWAWSYPAAHAVTSAALAASLLAAAAVVRRFDHLAAIGLGAAALAFAAAAAAGFGGPAFPPLAAVGATAMCAGPAVGAVVRRAAWFFTALAVLGALLVAESVLAEVYSWSLTDISAITVVLVMSVLPMVPRWAARLAGLRRPSGAHPEIPLTGDRLAFALSASRRATALAVGLDAGMACGLGAAAVALGGARSPWALALALAGLTALLLRSRSVDVSARGAALLVPAVIGLLAVTAILALRLPPAADHWLPIGAVLVAGALLSTNIVAARRPGTPAGRRALRVLEGAVVLALVPLAVMAVGGYDLVRHL